MAGDKFKGLFDFINNFGDATVNVSVHEPASGKTAWIFGRSEDCDFVYPAPKASRRHFQIELCDGHYYIQDLGSTNGTYLNGKRIDHKERIFSGDVITMGGVDISTVDPETLLKDYAIVFQDVVLFNDTIMGNIRLGRKDATDEEVMAAARAAQCDEFVQRLPEGYQTVVGENGSTLSGGERQRISIARALLKNAPIVLLDEATASLDVENETSLQTALSALLKDKTVLVIAHRMRTVMGADHVVVLADGHVAEEGTPEQLMERGGMFRHMVELQRESSNWQVGGNRGGS